MNDQLKNQQGIVLIVVLILIASATLIYGLSTSLMHLDELVASNVWPYAGSAEGQMESCIDNALSKLLNDSSVSGNVNVSNSNVTCVSAVSGSGNLRTITAYSTTTNPFSESIVRGATVLLNINTNPFTIVDYKDILD